MKANLLEDLKQFLETRSAPLIETRMLSDGTTELVFEPQDDEDGLCLIRVFRLPSDTQSN